LASLKTLESGRPELQYVSIVHGLPCAVRRAVSTIPAIRVFFSYAGSDAPATEPLVRALRAAGLEVFRDRDTLVPGQFWPERLERALSMADAVIVCLGPTGLGPWQKRETALALDRQSRDDGFPVIPLLLPGADDPPLGFLRLSTWVDLRDEPDDRQALAALLRAVRREPPSDDRNGADPRTAVCPYRGLEAFREEDAAFFCGREVLVERLASRVRTAPLSVLVGRSGSGKSSLLQAGLLPALRRDSAVAWQVVMLRPGAEPLMALAAAFDPPPADAGRARQLAQLNEAAACLRDGRVSLRQLALLMLDKQSDRTRLLLVVDQWEELYTQAHQTAGEAGDVARFVALVLEAADGERVHGVLALRADFYAEALRHPGLPQRLESHQVAVEVMDRSALERAVTGPAAAVGLRFEAGLLDRLLDDVGDEPGNLPLLEHALRELWLRRQHGLLSFGAYRAIGGIRGAIAERAHQAYHALPPSQQIAARRLLVSLVTPGAGREDSRARLALPEEAEERQVVRWFAGKEHRLLVTGTDPAGHPTVEVSHEALIRHWNELRHWVDESRELLRSRDRIQSARAYWEANGRPASLLLKGRLPLAEARRLLAQDGQIVIDDLRAYINASLRRDAARRWVAFVCMALVTAGSLLAAALFYDLQQREARARTTAEHAQAQAKAEAHRANGELRRAIEGDGQRLAQVARRHLEASQPHRAIMVAREAFGPLQEGLPLAKRPYVWQAADVLHQALATRPILRKVFRGHTGVVNMATFSPDGKRIVTAGTDGRAFILDTPTLKVERLIVAFPGFEVDPTGHEGPKSIDTAVFSPDGERLATTNVNGTVRLWHCRDGEQVLAFRATFQAHKNLPTSLAFSPDGLALLTTSLFEVKLWNAASGELLRELGGHGGDLILQGVFSPDGTRVAAIGSSGVAYIWDARTGEQLLRLGNVDQSQGYSVAFSPDGARLVTGHRDKARVWDVLTGQETLTLRGHSDNVGSVAFSPDGRHIVTTDAGNNAQALIWDATSGHQVASLLGHAEGKGLRSAAFSPDGRFIVTASMDDTVRLWEFTPPPPARLLWDERRVSNFAFSPDGSMVAATSVGAAVVWRSGHDVPVRLPTKKGNPASVVFSPDGLRVMVAGDDQSLESHIYDAQTLDPVGSFSPYLSTPLFPDAHPRFSPDGSRIVAPSGAFEGGRWIGDLARIWDARTGEALVVLRGHEGMVHTTQFIAQGDRVMTTATDGTIRFWSATHGSELVRIKVRDRGGIVWAAVSPDGVLVASGSRWNRACVWDTHTGELVTALEGARESTTVHRFTPDSRYLVTSDDQGVIGLWDPRDGTFVRALKGYEQGVGSVELTTQGDRLLAGGQDRTVRVWNTATGELLFFVNIPPISMSVHPLPSVLGSISAAFHPSGKQLLAQIRGYPSPALFFDLPDYTSIEDVVDAAYAAVPYQFTADERAELQLDLFGRPDPRGVGLDVLAVAPRR
jgi:WD40 repeat protein